MRLNRNICIGTIPFIDNSVIHIMEVPLQLISFNPVFPPVFPSPALQMLSELLAVTAPGSGINCLSEDEVTAQAAN